MDKIGKRGREGSKQGGREKEGPGLPTEDFEIRTEKFCLVCFFLFLFSCFYSEIIEWFYSYFVYSLRLKTRYTSST